MKNNLPTGLVEQRNADGSITLRVWFRLADGRVTKRAGASFLPGKASVRSRAIQEALAQRETFMREVNAGTYRAPSERAEEAQDVRGMLVADVVGQWLARDHADARSDFHKLMAKYINEYGWKGKNGTPLRLGDIRVNDVTLGHLEDWRNCLAAEHGLGPETVRKSVSNVKAVLRYARKHGLTSNRPEEFLKAPRGPQRTPSYLSPTQMASVLAAAEPWLRDILELILYGGGRRLNEVTRLKVSDIDRTTGIVHWFNSKTNREAPLPLSPMLAAVLDRVIASNGARHRAVCKRRGRVLPEPEYVIIDRSLKPYGEKDANKSIIHAVSHLSQKIGLKFTTRSFRHGAASAMAAAGVPMLEISKVLDHADPTTTAIYAHLQPQHARTGYAALEAEMRRADRTVTREVSDLSTTTT